MASNIKLLCAVIMERAWRNGKLGVLALMCLSGREIERKDTDLTEDKWNNMLEKYGLVGKDTTNGAKQLEINEDNK